VESKNQLPEALACGIQNQLPEALACGIKKSIARGFSLWNQKINCQRL
jgi:hypothetical protein